MTDVWAGNEVLDEQPTRCPACGSNNIENGMLSDTDEFDDELADACGYEPGNNHRYQFGTPFNYVYEEMWCDDCDAIYGYGQRWYWDEDSGFYSHDAPLTPVQEMKLQRERQERAGQMRLLP